MVAWRIFLKKGDVGGGVGVLLERMPRVIFLWSGYFYEFYFYLKAFNLLSSLFIIQIGRRYDGTVGARVHEAKSAVILFNWKWLPSLHHRRTGGLESIYFFFLFNEKFESKFFPEAAGRLLFKNNMMQVGFFSQSEAQSGGENKMKNAQLATKCPSIRSSGPHIRYYS